MVDLVLQAARLEALASDRRPPSGVAPRPRSRRAADVRGQLGDAQAALARRPRRPRRATTIRGLTSTSRPFVLGRLRVPGDVDGDDPHQLPELRRGEPDAVPERRPSCRRGPPPPARSRRVVVELPRHLLERGMRIAEDLADHYMTSGSSGRTVTSTPCSAPTSREHRPQRLGGRARAAARPRAPSRRAGWPPSPTSARLEVGDVDLARRRAGRRPRGRSPGGRRRRR